MIEAGLEKLVEKYIREFTKDVRSLISQHESDSKADLKLRETEISNLKSKIETLNAANFELKKTISGFEREHETMKAKIKTLERKNHNDSENVQKQVAEAITKIESQLEDVSVRLDQSEAANDVDMNEATDMIALDSDEDITCVDGETSPVIQRSGSRGSAGMPICSESENSNDCLFGGFASDDDGPSNDKKVHKSETSTNEKPTTSTNQKERPKRRYDPSNPPLFTKSEVFLRKVHEAQQEKRKSAKLSQRTTDRLLFGDGSDSDDSEPIEVTSSNTKSNKKSNERSNQKPSSSTRTNDKEDRTSAVFNRVMTYGQLNAEKKAEKQKSKPRPQPPRLLEQPELLTFEDCLPPKSIPKRNSKSPIMPKVTEVKRAYPIFKKDMKKYQDRATRDEQRKLKRKSTGENSASKMNRFCIDDEPITIEAKTVNLSESPGKIRAQTLEYQEDLAEWNEIAKKRDAKRKSPGSKPSTSKSGNSSKPSSSKIGSDSSGKTESQIRAQKQKDLERRKRAQAKEICGDNIPLKPTPVLDLAALTRFKNGDFNTQDRREIKEIEQPLKPIVEYNKRFRKTFKQL